MSSLAPRHGLLSRGPHFCIAKRVMYNLSDDTAYDNIPDSERHFAGCTVSIPVMIAYHARITRPRSDTTEVSTP